MGYYLQAIAGKRELLERYTSELRHVRVIPLAQDMAIIPLTDELFDEISASEDLGAFEDVDKFYKLSPRVEAWVKRISLNSPVGYLEADYFGGNGGQSAIAWSDGLRVVGPLHTEGAINQVLSFLGVRSGKDCDEFDAVGLGRHRETSDWISEEVE